MRSSASIEELLAAASPGRDVELLLRVIAADEPEATNSWRMWRTENGIAGAPRRQWRLFGAVGRKLLASDIDPSDRDALASVKRSIWHDNQLRINRHATIFERLNEAAIPTMVLKGGARIAGEAGAMEMRFVRDIDLLFPADRLVEALELLLAMGLRSVNGRLPGMVKSQAFAPIHPRGRRPLGYMEIDVHSVPLRLGQSVDNEEALWERSRPGKIGGIAVRIPSASDRYIQAIAHGLVGDDDGPADWVVDALVAIRDPAFQPNIVIEEIDRRRLGVSIVIGSLYLRDVLGVPVPESIIEACRRDASRLIYRLEMKGALKLSRQRTLFDRLSAEVAERNRALSGRSPTRSWNTSWLFRPSFKSPSQPWAVFQDGVAKIEMHPAARSSKARLRLFLSCPDSLLEDRSFDLLLDGVWIGRARLRATRLIIFVPHRNWRADIEYRFPFSSTDIKQGWLEILALDQRKMSSVGPIPAFRVAAGLIASKDTVRR